MIAAWRRLGPKGRTAAQATMVVAVMGSLGWAAVPLYDLFCRVTGYGGTTMVGTGADRVLDRTIRVRFDASVARGMPWTFRPVERQMELPIGADGMAFYEVHNPTDRPIAGMASYNVVPFEAGLHFVKIACFCFEYQVLQPGETVLMPVTFYVEPSIVDSPDARHVHTITLSYTFHEADVRPEDLAALPQAGATGTN
jgi:cytochrome c oxidase assembly protein subunit 11